MTNVTYFIVACGLCGQKSKHALIITYSQFGEPDLDGRPAPMLRNTMPYWLYECPFCGYVRDNLNKPCKISKTELKALYDAIETRYPRDDPPGLKQYRERLLQVALNPDTGETKIPRGEYHSGVELAKQFLKFGKLLAATGKNAEAARQFLRAAWLFEDAYKPEDAVRWRRAAIEQAMLALKDPDLKDRNRLFTMFVDMLRRVGEFDAVLKLKPPAWLYREEARLVEYQKTLAQAQDIAVHTMNEIPDYKQQSSGTFFLL